MSRNWFGGDAGSWLFETSGRNVVVPQQGEPVEFWSGEPEDLGRVKYGGFLPITAPQTPVDAVPALASAQVPSFWGPDDASVTRMWASCDGGVTGVWIITSTLSKVAATGSYTDLSDKPTIPSVPVQSVAGKTGSVTLVKGDVGLASVDNTSDANKPVSTAQATALAGKADLVAGKIPQSQVPAIALVSVVTVANAAARYALTSTDVQPGDVAVQTSTGQTFILADPDPSQSGSWREIPAIGKVQTVAGRQGAVVLDKTDVGLDQVANKNPTDLAADPAFSAAFVAQQAHGSTVGTTTLDGSGRPVISVTTPWGLRANGTAYYDPAGAAAGEEAVLTFTASGPTLVSIGA